jgi:4-amino-4-deoxy-L-arabinose transferase-like glycosyltransferase/glycosyltransferase involved in cell wall biosynthesis
MDQKTFKFFPELSVVVLCFQAGNGIRGFFDEVLTLLKRSGLDWEIVLVGNYLPGRPDDTPRVLRELALVDPSRIRVVAKEKLGMMGWDVRSGLDAAKGRYLAFIDGDGQMPSRDILLLYEKITRENLDLVKTRRIKRYDGWIRKTVTFFYNCIFAILFPGADFHDVNSKPKIFTREAYQKLDLKSDDWFLDAEMMIKARRLGLKVGEVPTVFLKNLQRKTFVRLNAVWEFVRNLFWAKIDDMRASRPKGKLKWGIVPILLAALAARFGLFWALYGRIGAANWLSDNNFMQPYFWQLAQNLLHYHAFTLSAAAPFVPNTFHVPLYPAFLAGLLAISASPVFIVSGHIVLSLLGLYLFYRLAMTLFGRTAALLAAGFFALEPLSAFQSLVGHSETLFLVFFFSALLGLAGFSQNGKLGSLALAGAFLGLAVLTRPVAQFALAVMASAVIIFGWKFFPRVNILKPLAVLVLSFFLVLSPWLMRNYHHYRTPQFSFLSGYTFYLYNVGDFLASSESGYGSISGRDRKRAELRQQFLKTINDPKIVRVDEDVSALLPYQSRFYSEGLKIIAQDPIGYLKYQLLFTASGMVNDGYRDILNAAQVKNYPPAHFLTHLVKPQNLRPENAIYFQGFWAYFLLMTEFFWILIYAAIAIFLFSLARLRRWQSFYWSALMLVWVVFFNGAAGSLSTGRYHFPSVPFLLLLLAAALAYAYDSLMLKKVYAR